MRTYQAGKDPAEAWGGETRAWVFDLIENPGHRRRIEQLAVLDLTRRAGCEAGLRALVTDDWDYQTLFHLGWCQSCRNASLALGMDTHKTAVPPHRRRALVIALVAGVAIAAPIAGSRMIGGGSDSRGGVAQQVLRTTPPTPGSTTPSTMPTATTTVSTTPPTVPIVDPIPRAKPANGGRHRYPLPHTT
ncbi:MAG: hypothetical protein QOE87_2764 [Gaiellales bacterium]|jgi:hypothetical protein|nr:hypothetical protein [Gaiellales bacterium]